MPTLTPNNRTYKPFTDPKVYADCWIQIADFPYLSVLSTKYGATMTQNMIISACASINRLCNRYFNYQEVDETFIRGVRDTAQFLQQFNLQNAPITSITDVYLQVLSTFLPVSLLYLQEFNPEGIIRLNPLNSLLSGALLSQAYPLAALNTRSLNVWIRYTTGYQIADIPYDIKFATYLQVLYMAQSLANPLGLESYKTQTYSQKVGVGRKANPILAQIDDLTIPYKIVTVR